ncbi:hypothetical protein [Cupriavidus metallidurans]|uniref:hypothetical protein n=1 Tax=Cupriavidus metallidurans TaxID=119219 RepID=UPI000A6BC767|nr:hypothetical protein [Cupriavidus metallidurans]
MKTNETKPARQADPQRFAHLRGVTLPITHDEKPADVKATAAQVIASYERALAQGYRR